MILLYRTAGQRLKMENDMSNELVEEYAKMIVPILSQAKRAYGARNQVSPAHQASREYTRLLTEFYNKGGSLPLLAKKLEVAYAGVRRRVVMSDVSVSAYRPKVRIKNQDIKAAATRVRAARQKDGDLYHDQLAEEYQAGISLSNLAKELGLSSAAPLYYGVQRSLQRKTR
jgi:hypothetical protein